MPEEQVGFGPAALENPEADASFATKNESFAEVAPEKTLEAELVSEAKSSKYEKLLQTVSSPVTTALPQDEEKVDLEHLQTLEGEEQKIEQLVKLAHAKGLPHAVRVADRLKDYYALDMFHDTLVDNLYDQLVKEGLITKE